VRVLTGPEGAGAGELSDRDLERLYEPSTLPWLRVNMVTTVDGAATGESGRSGSINNVPDKRVFGTLRRLADVIIVGAGTARAEGYGPGDTPIVVVSRRGEIPENLRGAPPGFVLLATCETAQGLDESRALLGAEHVLVLGADSVDLVRLRDRLETLGHHDLLCEGGPHLLRDLLDAGVVDELTATVVPRLVAGAGPRITAGAPVDVPLELTLLLEEGGTLLGRWSVVRSSA
jgi:riboflavin biosynthesis pyrimidine reductase